MTKETLEKRREVRSLDIERRIIRLVAEKAPDYLISFHQNRYYILTGEYVEVKDKK